MCIFCQMGNGYICWLFVAAVDISLDKLAIIIELSVYGYVALDRSTTLRDMFIQTIEKIDHFASFLCFHASALV